MTLIIHTYARPKLRVRRVVGPGASTVIAGAGRALPHRQDRR